MQVQLVVFCLRLWIGPQSARAHHERGGAEDLLQIGRGLPAGADRTRPSVRAPRRCRRRRRAGRCRRLQWAGRRRPAGVVGGAAGVVFRHVDEKFQAAGERRRADAKYGLSAAIFVKGAHGDETLFAGVAEQGFGEDLDLIAVGFEQSALTGVTHGAKCRGGLEAGPCIRAQNGISSSITPGDSLLRLLRRDLSLGRRRWCGVGHFPAHDFE